MTKQTHVYHGRCPPGRSELRHQPVTLLNTWRRGAPHNVLVELEDGQRFVCPLRCLRKLEGTKQ